MIENRFTIASVTYLDGGEDDAASARTRYKEYFPGRTSRRMTHLGMMIGVCLHKVGARKEVPIIYASAFGESASLEKYIDSFPQASPSLFQSSIHPSAVEQALIPNKQAIDRFYPITSDLNLMGKALENCFLMGEDEVVLLGGEEKGDWLCPFGLASDISFAFGMKLERGESGIGTVSWKQSEEPLVADRTEFPKLAHAIANRQAVRLPSFALDAWIQIDWR